jgi:hypothetical protein
MINIDRVYRTVLSVLNKEQRGFITPEQFNRIGNQAQLELLDKAFSDYNAFVNNRKAQKSNSGYGNTPSKIKEKIDIFYKSSTQATSGDDTWATAGLFSLPIDVYKLINITANNVEIELVDRHELPYLMSSPLTKPSPDFPIYYKDTTSLGVTNVYVEPIYNGTANGDTLNAWTLGDVTVNYIKLPVIPNWYFTWNGDTYVHDGTNLLNQNFELHPSEEMNLVIRILAHAGVTLKDPNVVQQAQQQEIIKTQQQSR